MRNLFIHTPWFLILTVNAILFFAAFFMPWLWYVAIVLLITFLLLTLLDCILLWSGTQPLEVNRRTADRWHLGEENEVHLVVRNQYRFAITVSCIDEVPEQFQLRDFRQEGTLRPGAEHTFVYTLSPLSRGAYYFNDINVMVCSPLKLMRRRMIYTQSCEVKVYPTTKFIKNYQLMATSDRNQLVGTKKIRRLGHSLEFEQIKEYVHGDDIRTINWKATARRQNMMVNTFTDVRAQQIYCIIDKGRSMKMPFEGMTLMDHAIKSALVFMNVALYRHDKVGLITFASGVQDILPAEGGAKQMSKILETLYHQQTDFLDADFERLAVVSRHKLNQRSFLMLYTNFESLASLERQIPYLRNLAKRHLLCVVFFENTAIKSIKERQPDTIQGIYTRTIADRFDYEKKQMVKELRRYGIIALLTTPEQLTIDVVNNYLELKSRQTI